MRKHALILTFASVSSLLAGCMQTWMPGGNRITAKSGCSLTVPAGWTYLNTADKGILATKDGLFLQRLSLDIHPIATPLPNSKRKLNPGMSALELAEAVIDEARAAKQAPNIEIKENAPATLGGKEAFRILTLMRTADGLRLTSLQYGCIQDDNLVVIRYTAPSRHYYDLDASAFEEVVQSLQWSSAVVAQK